MVLLCCETEIPDWSAACQSVNKHLKQLQILILSMVSWPENHGVIPPYVYHLRVVRKMTMSLDNLNFNHYSVFFSLHGRGNKGKREGEKRGLKGIPTISCSSSLPFPIEVGLRY